MARMHDGIAERHRLKPLVWLTGVGLGPVVAAIFAVPAVASLAPQIALSAGSAAPNTRIVVTGSGFPANEIVALYLDTPNLYLDVPGPRADAQGSFARTITVPLATNGDHQVCGDTAYPGSSQPVPAKACVPLRIFGAQLSSPTPGPSTASQPASLPEIAAFAAAVIVLVVGLIVWMRKAA